MGWRDRHLPHGGVRADDNSAFGQNFDRVYYPKFSASWVISEEPFWTVRARSTRSSCARPTASPGKQPITYSALQTYTPAAGPSDAATLRRIHRQPGSRTRSAAEIELGFDTGALNDRLGLELTYYNKKTTDAILDREHRAVARPSDTQPFNAGSIKN